MHKINNRRYAGSKYQLANWILDLILTNCEGDSFVDLFAGTGIVAQTAAAHYSKVYVNDFLPSNFAAYKAFFDKGEFDQDKLVQISEEYNKLNPKELPDNYFSISYGGKFFSEENAKKIGAIRELIEADNKHITEHEYWILLTSLMYSVDKVANTVGHYDAFFKTAKNTNSLQYKLVEPNTQGNFVISQRDANEFVKDQEADIIYIDPPYNSRQYSRFYHVLDNLVTWNKPELFGVARKPLPENMSEYSKSGAKKSFTELIKNLRCKYIVVSYNNTYTSKSSSSKNKMTLDDIASILDTRGETIKFSKRHKHFNTGKTNFSDHKEYLFITRIHA